MSNSDAPWPISSSGVKPTRSVGRGSSRMRGEMGDRGHDLRHAGLVVGAQQRVAARRDDVVAGLARQHRHLRGIEHRPAARQLDHAAVVAAVHDRLDAGAAARRGSRPCARAARSRARRRTGQRREHVAVVVEVDVLQAGRPAARPRASAPGRAGRACSGCARGRGGTACPRARSAGSAPGRRAPATRRAATLYVTARAIRRSRRRSPPPRSACGRRARRGPRAPPAWPRRCRRCRRRSRPRGPSSCPAGR